MLYEQNEWNQVEACSVTLHNWELHKDVRFLRECGLFAWQQQNKPGQTFQGDLLFCMHFLNTRVLWSSICLSIYQSISLSICLSIYQSINLSIYLSLLRLKNWLRSGSNFKPWYPETNWLIHYSSLFINEVFIISYSWTLIVLMMSGWLAQPTERWSVVKEIFWVSAESKRAVKVMEKKGNCSAWHFFQQFSFWIFQLTFFQTSLPKSPYAKNNPPPKKPN